MRTKQFYLAIILGAAMFCGGAFAQGKGGGKHGGGNGNGKNRGGEMRVERGKGGDKGRGREMRVENGNEKWRGNGGDRGNENWKNRGGDRDVRQERQPQVDWEKRRQQQQDEWNARRQRQIKEWNDQRQRQIDNDRGRRQQDTDEWNARRQRQIIDDNERFERQRDKHNRKIDKRNDKWNDRGGFPIFSDRDRKRKDRKHDGDYRNERFDRGGLWQGWDNFPRGNAYGRRGIWPGEFRGWRDPDKQARKFEKRDRKRGDYRDNYYYRDDRGHVFNNSDDRDYDRDDYYDDRYSRDDRDDRDFVRENIIRSILSNVLGGGFDNGQDLYSSNYYPQQRYVSYARAYPAYYDYQPSYAAVPNYYSPVFYNDAYYGDGNYGDSYNNSSPFLSDIFGGGDSGWMGIVGQLLSGLLGQGYLQGLNDGEYARTSGLGNDTYYNPYDYADASYAPYAASLGQERSCLREGYELGYRDAMRNRDPFDAGQFGGLDLLSAFLGDGLRFN